LGYWWEYQVLNSKHFGVPQNRQRVFIIGHLGERSSRPIFPIKEVHRNDSEGNKAESWGQIGATLSSRSAGGQNARGNYVVTPRDISTTLDANYWKGPDKHDARTVIFDYLNRSIREDKIFNTIKTSQGSPSSAPTILHNLYGGFKEGVREFDAPSPTIRTAKGGGHIPSLLKDMKIRRLTPIECERLQGFPDRWTEGVSDTQRYRLLGNAVTVNVIEHLGRLIMSSFTNKGDTK